MFFSLLSDPKRDAEKAFKVPRNLFGLLPGRVTFVFNNEGKLVHSLESALNATKHIKESLKALKNIK
jgi:peroxiredoxin Q/BCP